MKVKKSKGKRYSTTTTTTKGGTKTGHSAARAYFAIIRIRFLFFSAFLPNETTHKTVELKCKNTDILHASTFFCVALFHKERERERSQLCNIFNNATHGNNNNRRVKNDEENNFSY